MDKLREREREREREDGERKRPQNLRERDKLGVSKLYGAYSEAFLYLYACTNENIEVPNARLCGMSHKKNICRRFIASK